MPFQWKFDRTKLAALLAKIEARQMASQILNSTAWRKQHNLVIISETEHLATALSWSPKRMRLALESEQ
jgi:hypothetical protein